MKVRELRELLSSFDQDAEVTVDASSAPLTQQDVAFLEISDVNLDEEGNVSLEVE